MSTTAVSAPPSSTSRVARGGLVRRAKVLSWLSVGWMTVEAGASIAAALVAGSVALLGFGLDSLIELASASIVIWRLTGDRIQSDAAERRAQQLIAGCFASLAVYLVYDGVATLLVGPHPAVSWVGVAVSTGAVIVMPALARAKSRVAAQLGSGAVRGDASQSWLCAIGAAGVLVSIFANAALGWRWLDPIIGFGIAGVAVHECREAWAGEVCADCAPVGFEARDASGCERCTHPDC